MDEYYISKFDFVNEVTKALIEWSYVDDIASTMKRLTPFPYMYGNVRFQMFWSCIFEYLKYATWTFPVVLTRDDLPEFIQRAKNENHKISKIADLIEQTYEDENVSLVGVILLSKGIKVFVLGEYPMFIKTSDTFGNTAYNMIIKERLIRSSFQEIKNKTLTLGPESRGDCQIPLRMCTKNHKTVWKLMYSTLLPSFVDLENDDWYESHRTWNREYFNNLRIWFHELKKAKCCAIDKMIMVCPPTYDKIIICDKIRKVRKRRQVHDDVIKRQCVAMMTNDSSVAEWSNIKVICKKSEDPGVPTDHITELFNEQDPPEKFDLWLQHVGKRNFLKHYETTDSYILGFAQTAEDIPVTGFTVSDNILKFNSGCFSIDFLP
ncbi:hypothetical protein [Salmon gill poxvirus]